MYATFPGQHFPKTGGAVTSDAKVKLHLFYLQLLVLQNNSVQTFLLNKNTTEVIF